MEKINILFLGGSKRVSVANAFISAGDKMNKQVSIYTYDLNVRIMDSNTLALTHTWVTCCQAQLTHV